MSGPERNETLDRDLAVQGEDPHEADRNKPGADAAPPQAQDTKPQARDTSTAAPDDDPEAARLPGVGANVGAG